MSPRSSEEWIGVTPDSRVPDHVKLRIWRREKGRCHISGRKITPSDAWDLDHKIPLRDGGQHREGNLFLALRSKHREKTAQEASARALADRIAKRHLGITSPKSKIPQRPKPPRLHKRRVPPLALYRQRDSR